MIEDFSNLNAIGKPIDRIEAKAKVSGSAKYAADYSFEDLAYGVVVTTTISKLPLIQKLPSGLLAY
jgi:CO/xanthine dehydrogenase Mo-binding subunit